MGKLLSTVFSYGMISIYFLLPLGWIYWLWIAVKIGGFAMFALALFPITAPFSAIFGIWSFFFGMPQWAYNLLIP